MHKLSKDQRQSLADVCGNLAVAWLTAGVIIPILSEELSIKEIQQIAQSVLLASILIASMLYLTRGKKK